MWIQAVIAGLGIGNENTQKNIDQKQETANQLGMFLNRDTNEIDLSPIIFIVILIIVAILIFKSR